MPTIVAMGGLSWDDAERRRLEDYVLGLTGHERPRLLFVPTAVGDAAEATLRVHSQLGDQAEVSYLPFFPWPPPRLRELALEQDVIYVSGGNTANALAIWRVHGFDEILREAWDAGVVLAGWSAGML
ncbi:MAG: Type 1 glutamine amidotransferase-like domain-containing protein, partial [Actinomycetota bacterium]|nr:Type 1 glutamine amidotransferase-like domain-containing protein [Actinomycetota bacterium]